MRQIHRQTGAAILETILCLPFLLILIMGIVDVGRFINLHFTASRFAYEASRFAAVVPQLEKAPFSTTFNYFGTPSSAVLPNQTKVVQRFSRLIRQFNAREQIVDGVTLKFTFNDDCSDDENLSRNKAIEVEVEVPFKSLFPLLNLNVIRVKANTGYLYAKETPCVVS